MDHLKELKEKAENNDRIANEIFAPVYPFVAEKAISRTGIHSGRLLDIGCGEGYLGLAVMETGHFEGSFLDVNQESLRLVQQHLKEQGRKGHTVVGDVQAMPFEAESFDLVVSRGSMPFWEDQEQAFREIWRVLKPDGRAYIGVGYGSAELREQIRGRLKLKDGEPGGPRSRGIETRMYPDNAPYEKILKELGADYHIFDSSTGEDADGRWFLFGRQLFSEAAVRIHSREKEVKRVMEERKRHLFLTGEIQVGKSTILRRFLASASLPPEQVGGFLSRVQILPDGSSRVHLVSPAGLDDLNEENCIMTRQPKRQENPREKRGFPEIYPDVFERRGVELLQTAEDHRLILMDELGFAERKSPAFRKRVLEVLDGEVPVLGVLKKWSYEFLDRVAEHPAVTVVVVTEENRNQIAEMMTFAWSLLRPSGPDS